MSVLDQVCRSAGTTIICGGPFNSGILVGRETWNYAKAPAEIIDKACALTDVADAFGVPLAAAALQFPLANDLVTSVIPGPRDKGELQQNLKWFMTPIPRDFWVTLMSKRLLHEGAPVPAGN